MWVYAAHPNMNSINQYLVSAELMAATGVDGTATCRPSDGLDSTMPRETMDDDMGDTTASGSVGGRNGSSSVSISSDGAAAINTRTNSTPTAQLPDRYGFTGGSQYTRPETIKAVAAEVVRKRELKWLDMIENWDKYMTKKYKKVRERCRKGIPPSLRARAWQHLCGATTLLEQNKHKFYELESQPGDPRYIDDIRKDLHRQFPFHEMFMNREGHGQEDLFRILKAFTVLNPVDGYCQAQAPIAAILLMHMPAEHAFWCLVSICDKYLPGYYSQGLEAIQMDGEILYGLVKKVSPQVHKQLKKQHIEPVLYMTEWFMCVFTRTLPWSSVLRIWDMFFCEGVKVMFRTALVLLKFSLGQPDTPKRCPTMYETLEILRNIPGEIMQEDFLVEQMMRIGVNEIDMENEHAKQIARQRALRDKKLKRIKGKS